MFRFELKAIQVSQITAVTPKKTTLVVNSDSGTQLVGANKQLQGNFKMMKQDVLEK